MHVIIWASNCEYSARISSKRL